MFVLVELLFCMSNIDICTVTVTVVLDRFGDPRKHGSDFILAKVM